MAYFPVHQGFRQKHTERIEKHEKGQARADSAALSLRQNEKEVNAMVRCKNDCPEGKYNGCCSECPHGADCESKCANTPQDCADAIFEGTEVELFQNQSAAVIQKIGLLVEQKAEIEEAEKEMRKQLQQVMEKYGIKKFDNDLIKITYIEPTTRSSIDSVKLKAQMPEIAAKFTKTSNVKAFVKIELKGDEGNG